MKYNAPIRLEEICSKIGSGATPTGGASAYKIEGISLIRSQNILDYIFDKEGLAFIDEQQAKRLNNVTVESGDILINITGDSVARVCTVPDYILPARVNQHVCIIRMNNKITQSFLFYYLQYIKPYLLQLSSSGATRNALTKEMISNLELKLPEEKIQRSIVNILDCLNEKIMLNSKINDNLEELLSVLFKRLNEFECQKTIELGDIAEIIDGDRGKNYPKQGEMLEEGFCLFLNAGNVTNTGFDFSNNSFITVEKDTLLNKGKLERNDIILTTRGTVGNKSYYNCGVEFEHMRINSGMVIIRNHEYPEYIFELLKSDYMTNKIKTYSSGSAQPQLPIKDMKRIPVPMLLTEIIYEYNEKAKILEDMISQNKKENRKLIGLRDLLLPMLMSGKIDLSNLELDL